MIKPLHHHHMHVDIFHNYKFICSASQFEHLDIRRQICEQSLTGYSMKISPKFMHFFDKEDNIHDFVVNIDENGEVDKWFPEYRINDDYPYVGVFQESFQAVLKLKHARSNKKP